jgi:hypothetical protein
MRDVLFHPVSIDPTWSVRDGAVRLALHVSRRWRRLGSWLDTVSARCGHFIDTAADALHSAISRRSFAGRTCATVIAPAPDRITVEDQWARAFEAATEAAHCAGNADELQAAARSQVDAATYALERLLEEIAPLMTVARPPATGAVVRKLEPSGEVAPQRSALAA